MFYIVKQLGFAPFFFLITHLLEIFYCSANFFVKNAESHEK